VPATGKPKKKKALPIRKGKIHLSMMVKGETIELHDPQTGLITFRIEVKDMVTLRICGVNEVYRWRELEGIVYGSSIDVSPHLDNTITVRMRKENR
jgi:hypothetical protein